MNGDQDAGDGRAPSGSGDQPEACRYISETLADLVAMAATHRLHTLRYLLKMARQEADDVIRALPPDAAS